MDQKAAKALRSFRGVPQITAGNGSKPLRKCRNPLRFLLLFKCFLRYFYEVLQGIIRFALYGEEPELKGAALGVFESIRPHLTAGRDKAAWRLRRNAAAAAEPADSLSAVHFTVRM